MPATTGTSPRFPVLRRGRKRITPLHAQEGDGAAMSSFQPGSLRQGNNDAVEVHTNSVKSSSNLGRVTSTTVTSSTETGTRATAPSSDASASTIADSSPHPGHRRSRYSVLNPLRFWNGTAATRGPSQPQPEPEIDPCPVCLDPVGVANAEGVTETWARLQCGHHFGSHCIVRWMLDSLTRDNYTNPCCPVCRQLITHPCGHLLVMTARSSRLPADDSDDDDGYGVFSDQELGEGTRGIRASQDSNNGADDTEAQKEKTRRRHFSMLSAVTVPTKIAVLTGAGLLRLIGPAAVQVYRLSRRLLLRGRDDKQAVAATESLESIQMVPGPGYCSLCTRLPHE